MVRAIGLLTAIKVQSLRQPGYYSDGGNLYFRLADSGSRGWIFRFVSPTRGKTRDMGLGSYPDVSLAKARELATECRQKVKNGVDPIAARDASRAAAKVADAKSMTFDQCSANYIAAHESGWRNPKHRQQWTNTLKTYASPVFGDLPVQAVDTRLVLRVLEPIWKAKPETASRLRGRIEAVLDWARVREFRGGENPARWRGHLDHLLPAKSKVRRVEHHAALPYTNIGAFMVNLRALPSISARALEFLILTATRTSETLGATWDEFDFGTRLWEIPACRMKRGREHRVPLSPAALAILQSMRAVRQSDLVFPGARKGRPLSAMAMLMLLRRMGFGKLTSHGFRSTFRDWAAERTSHPREVAEMALAHAIGDAVEAAYRRGDLFDKRRKLMDSWATYCAKVEVKDASKVVLIAARNLAAQLS
jgi:integrase